MQPGGAAFQQKRWALILHEKCSLVLQCMQPPRVPSLQKWLLCAVLRARLRSAVGRMHASLAKYASTGHDDLMKHVSIAHAKAHFSELLADAEHHGRTAVIENRGKAVAHLVPVPKPLARRNAVRQKARAKLIAAFRAAVRDLTSTTTNAGSLLADLASARGRLE
jgi:antitoxin (DNA-binding transcriptional repressor) of toxin-antitoxin stability system